MDLLQDETKFSLIKEDPYKISLRLEDKVNRILRNLKENNSIDEATYTNLYTSGSSPGYGLPKVHKDNLPLRPIVSTYNTHNYNLCNRVERNRHFSWICLALWYFYGAICYIEAQARIWNYIDVQRFLKAIIKCKKWEKNRSNLIFFADIWKLKNNEILALMHM